MNIFQKKLRAKLMERAVEQARAEPTPKNLEPGELVILYDDTTQVYEIQTLNPLRATLSPFDENGVNKEVSITMPTSKLISVNDILSNYRKHLKDFNQPQGKKILLK